MQLGDRRRRFPFASLLTALAPPASALEGSIVARQLTAPIVFGSTATGQLFLPLRDPSNTLAMILVVLGDWDEIKSQLPQLRSENPLHRKPVDEAIVRFAQPMVQPRFAATSARHKSCHRVGDAACATGHSRREQFSDHWPRHVGKADVTRGIFAGRLRRLGIQKLAGQLFPLDCAVMESELLLACWKYSKDDCGRLFLAPRRCWCLNASTSSVTTQSRPSWSGINQHHTACTVAATSSDSTSELCRRSGDWHRSLLLLHLLNCTCQN